MGIFKAKGASRVERRAVFSSPFTMNRRLSKITEEEDGTSNISDHHHHQRPGSAARRLSIGGNSRNNTPNTKGTPNRNRNSNSKLTPTKLSWNRFQKLEHQESYEPPSSYGPAGSQEEYEPPQDFMQVQKNREDLFFQNGPEPNRHVQQQIRKTNSNKLSMRVVEVSKQQPEGPSHSNTKNLFQLAAATASLSRSCSSESASVDGNSSSSHAGSSKRSFRASFDSLSHDDNESEEVEQPQGNKHHHHQRSVRTNASKGSVSSAPQAASSNLSQEDVAKSTTFPVSKSNNKRAKTANQENDSKLDETLFMADFSKNQFATDNNSDFAAFPVSFPTTTTAKDFDNVEWPTDNAFGTQAFEIKKSTSVESNVEEDNDNGLGQWPTRTVSEDASIQDELSLQKTEESRNAAYNKAKSLFETSESLFKQNKVLFGDENMGQSYSTKTKKTTHKSSTSRPGDMASPLKENETVRNRSIYNKNNKAVQFKGQEKTVKFKEQEKTLSSPLMELGSKGGRTELSSRIQTPGRKQEPRATVVSFLFDSDTREVPSRDYAGKPSLKPIETGTRNTKDMHQVSQSRFHSRPSVTSNLGAIPRASSPKSLHLFYDKTNSYDDSLNRISTFDSCDTSSTATSASTFVDASPKGIRGGFPTHLAPTFSSMTSSTASSSTGILNKFDYYKPSNHHAQSSTANMPRPPTAVPPTSIMGSMLFQAGEQESASAERISKSFSPKREQVRGVPKSIKAHDDAAISDVTGCTEASDWHAQGTKLLNRYYYNSHDGVSQKKHNLSRQLRKREESNLEEFGGMVAGIQQKREAKANKNRIGGFVSEFNNRNDPTDKMRRHHHQVHFSAPRSVRSGFDNMEDDDANSLFEA